MFVNNMEPKTSSFTGVFLAMYISIIKFEVQVIDISK